jgi:thioredoxin 1
MIEHLVDKTFDQRLAKERIAVVKVWASWCGPCKFLDPHYRKWAKQLNNVHGVDIPYFAVDNDKNRQFVEKYQVKSLPTILIMVHGMTIYKIEGVTRQNVVEDLIRKALRVKVEYNGED